MTYREFRIDTLKANRKKHMFKVQNSYGARDAYRWAVKNRHIGRELPEKDFRTIVNALNYTLQDRLLQGKDAKFPEQMGKVEIRKCRTHTDLKDGRIVTNLAIDWDSTLKLWYEDEDARKNKTLVRCETDEKFKFIYNKRGARYNNKVFYEFTPTRGIKLKLKKIIGNEGFDALLLSNKNGLYRYKRHSRQDKEKPVA